MKPVNKVTKEKERLIFLLDSMEELDSFNFSKYIPSNAKKVEINSRENKGQRILEIDYLVKIESKEILKEEKENGRY